MPLAVPSAVPSEIAHLQANDRKGQRSAPFGGSDGLVCLFSNREKYCHNGGMAFADLSAVAPTGRAHARSAGALGSMMPLAAPYAVPSEVADLQANVHWGPSFAPFGGRNGLDRFFCRRVKYCQHGAIASAD